MKKTIEQQLKENVQSLRTKLVTEKSNLSEWEFTSPSSWFNGRGYGDATSRDDARKQDISQAEINVLRRKAPQIVPGVVTTVQDNSNKVWYGLDKDNKYIAMIVNGEWQPLGGSQTAATQASGASGTPAPTGSTTPDPAKLDMFKQLLTKAGVYTPPAAQSPAASNTLLRPDAYSLNNAGKIFKTDEGFVRDALLNKLRLLEEAPPTEKTYQLGRSAPNADGSAPEITVKTNAGKTGEAPAAANMAPAPKLTASEYKLLSRLYGEFKVDFPNNPEVQPLLAAYDKVAPVWSSTGSSSAASQVSQDPANMTLIQDREKQAPGSVASEVGKDGVTYAVDANGMRTFKIENGKWVAMKPPIPTENPELQGANTKPEVKPEVEVKPNPIHREYAENTMGIGSKDGDKTSGPTGVTDLQRTLVEKGYLDKHHTDKPGRFGDSTRLAVIKLQKELKSKNVYLGTGGPNGDGIDGVFGPTTRDAANEKLQFLVTTVGPVKSGTDTTVTPLGGADELKRTKWGDVKDLDGLPVFKDQKGDKWVMPPNTSTWRPARMSGEASGGSGDATTSDLPALAAFTTPEQVDAEIARFKAKGYDMSQPANQKYLQNLDARKAQLLQQKPADAKTDTGGDTDKFKTVADVDAEIKRVTATLPMLTASQKESTQSYLKSLEARKAVLQAGGTPTSGAGTQTAEGNRDKAVGARPVVGQDMKNGLSVIGKPATQADVDQWNKNFQFTHYPDGKPMSGGDLELSPNWAKIDPGMAAILKGIKVKKVNGVWTGTERVKDPASGDMKVARAEQPRVVKALDALAQAEAAKLHPMKESVGYVNDDLARIVSLVHHR